MTSTVQDRSLRTLSVSTNDGTGWRSAKKFWSMPENSQSMKHIAFGRHEELLLSDSRCWSGGVTAWDCDIAGTRSWKVPGVLGSASQPSKIGEQGGP